jgi:type IV pilus assembly protein PilM
VEAKLSKQVRVGLDIGSSAVRAAEVSIQGTRTEVTRFAQVGLPEGAVVEGEVRNQAVVSAAIKRLWSEGGFKQRDVVLGISSQRSMVRLVEMPKMRPDELRSAVRYEAGDLLPIPLEEAVLDFAPLGPGKPKGDGGETIQVLLVVAQRDLVQEHIGVVRKAGLRVRAVDSSPLALVRAVPAPSGGGLEAIVSVGAQLMVVVVRDGPVPRFVRTVTRPGAASGAGAVSADQVVGAARSFGLGRPQAGGVLGLDPIIEEVRGSLEYFMSHAHAQQLSNVLVTGGGALDAGIVDQLASVLGMPVKLASIGPAYTPSRLGLQDKTMGEASLRWTTAVGLALWGTGGIAAPSLIPAEIKQRRQFQQAVVACGAGLVVAAAGLGGLSYEHVQQVSSVRAQTTVYGAQAAGLQAKIVSYRKVMEVKNDVQTVRTLAAQDLSGDVNWVSLVKRIEASLPPGVTLTALTLSRSNVVGSPTPSSAAASPQDIGSLGMALTTTGGPPSVAEFVRKLWVVPGLYALWAKPHLPPPRN